MSDKTATIEGRDDEKIPCPECYAVDCWKGEERIIDGQKYGVIVCTNCGKADAGFFIAEVDTVEEKKKQENSH